MIYQYSLVPADEVIMRDVPIYSSTTVFSGALLQLGATDPDSNADQGISFIPAYATSSSATCIDTVGILNDSSYVSVTPGNVYATNASGAKYGKVIINPFAVYSAEWLQDTGNDANAHTSSSTVLSFDGLEDDIDGGWVLGTSNNTSANNKKAIRMINTCAAGKATLDSAFTTAVATGSSNTFIIVRPVNHRLLRLSADSLGLTSSGGTEGGYVTGNAVSLHIIENWIMGDAISKEPLRSKFRGKDSLSGARIFSDIAQLDHVYNNLS